MHAFTALWLSALDAKYLDGNWNVCFWKSYLWKDSPRYDHILTTFQEGTECNPIVTSDCLHCYYRLSWVGIKNANLSILFFSDSLWLLMDSLSLKKQLVTFQFFHFKMCVYTWEHFLFNSFHLGAGLECLKFVVTSHSISILDIMHPCTICGYYLFFLIPCQLRKS